MIFHGLTSHTNEGAYVAKELAKKGYEVVGFDQRGFGKSEGTRGYLRDFSTNLADSGLFLQIVKEKYPGEKLFLLGLSLGGLTSYALALAHFTMFTGCILMAPALRSHHGTGSYLAAKVLSFFLPNTQVPKVGRGGKRGSKNPNVSELRKNDKFRYL
jgi:acylglycerol lipase